jgi:hypothetical protein
MFNEWLGGGDDDDDDDYDDLFKGHIVHNICLYFNNILLTFLIPSQKTFFVK